MQTIQTGETIKALIKSQEKCKQYKLDQVLGLGTGGIVYEAHNIWDESDIIAIKKEKEVFGNSLDLYKVMEEKRLDNVVNILFVQEEEPEKSYFIGMDKGDGTITKLIEEWRKKCLSYNEQMVFYDEMIKQVATGIYSIHANQIIHRDLKPDNIVYKQIGNEYYYMICDLGLAKQQNQSVKLTSGVGTPIYMAPELFKNELNYDSSVDIWAFGVMIYQLLANQELFQGQSIQEIQNQIKDYELQKLDENFKELQQIPKQYQNLLKLMLVKDPNKRINIKQILEYLDKEKLNIAFRKYGQADKFSDWEIFKRGLNPEVKTKLLIIQTKLRPHFVNQRELIYQVLIKIGEQLVKLQESKDQDKAQQEQPQNQEQEQSSTVSNLNGGVQGQKSNPKEKEIILKYTSEYFDKVKNDYLQNYKENQNN